MSNNALQTIINARLPGKEGLWQIHLQDGKISAIDAQSGVMPITENSLDAEQGLVIPPFVEPHIHLDTTQTAGQPNWNQSGTLFEGIERWAERKALLTHDDVKQRAWQTLKWQIANGIQHVRTHVANAEMADCQRHSACAYPCRCFGCNANCAESNAGSEAGSRAVD